MVRWRFDVERRRSRLDGALPMGIFDWMNRWIARPLRSNRPAVGNRPGIPDAPDPRVLRGLEEFRSLPAWDPATLDRFRRAGIVVLKERSTGKARELLARPLPTQPRRRSQGWDRLLLERAALKREFERLGNAGEIEERRFEEAMAEWSGLLVTGNGQVVGGPADRQRAEECLRRAVHILDSIARRPVANLRRAELRFEHACRQFVATG